MTKRARDLSHSKTWRPFCPSLIPVGALGYVLVNSEDNPKGWNTESNLNDDGANICVVVFLVCAKHYVPCIPYAFRMYHAYRVLLHITMRLLERGRVCPRTPSCTKVRVNRGTRGHNTAAYCMSYFSPCIACTVFIHYNAPCLLRGESTTCVCFRPELREIHDDTSSNEVF